MAAPLRRALRSLPQYVGVEVARDNALQGAGDVLGGRAMVAVDAGVVSYSVALDALYLQLTAPVKISENCKSKIAKSG